MAAKKLTVVISQTQGKNPAQRHLEEEIATALILEPDVDVSLVPHLYDLTRDHTGTLFLKSVPGDMLVLAWLFPRATRWILDRNGIKGQEGVSLLDQAPEDEDEDAGPPPEPQGIGAWDVPKRKIYCLDLRDHSDPKVYLDEIRRISRESSVQTVDLMQWIQGSPQASQLQRYLQPKLLRSAGQNGTGTDGAAAAEPADAEAEAVRRRWYPVIDYSRCTNCMECIDFCLFGVYGVDKADRILVEQQDNCKKGCPACSRVCPENAIMFPGHKTSAIAGAMTGEVSGLKIDLSKLFGAPSALELAAQERDQELVADGREAVGMTVGIPKRQADKPQTRDALDDLMDGLDNLGL
jgi:hypothetical protein